MPVTGASSEGGDGERRAPAGSREALAEGMLRACAELGYERVAVADVVARGRGEEGDFYRHFADLAHCYEVAYEAETARLCDEILARGASARDWRAGLHAAIAFAVEFVSTQPDRARALLIDVHLAGESVEHRRQEVSERLARALDTAREEPDAQHLAPPLTGLFMVSTIEAAAVSALVRDEPAGFAAAAPELEQLVASAYFDDD